MGDITIKVSENVAYDTADMFLELNKGENVLTPDKTYKYMKNKYLFFLLVLTTLSFTSCIQDEAPNAECDIVSVDAAWLEEYKDIMIGKPIVKNDIVKISIRQQKNIHLHSMLAVMLLFMTEKANGGKTTMDSGNI